MKKRIMKVLLLVCGLNVFTACYGMLPGDWEPVPESVDQQEMEDQQNNDSDDDAEDEEK